MGGAGVMESYRRRLEGGVEVMSRYKEVDSGEGSSNRQYTSEVTPRCRSRKLRKFAVDHSFALERFESVQVNRETKCSGQLDGVVMHFIKISMTFELACLRGPHNDLQKFSQDKRKVASAKDW